MKPSIRHLCTGLLAGGAILLAAAPASAGNVNWAVSIGVPAPVVYAPPPAYYPAPVVYGAPAYYPAPPVAPVVYVSGGHRYHHPHYRAHQARHWGHPHRNHYRRHY